MFPRLLPSPIRKVPAFSHSTTQESIILSPTSPNFGRIGLRGFFQDKRPNFTTRSVPIRQSLNPRPKGIILLQSPIVKSLLKDTSHTKKNRNMLNITDSFQYQSEDIVGDINGFTEPISKIRRKSDVSSWSGGISTFAKKIGPLNHESLYKVMEKVSNVPRSGNSSPSRLRRSVKRGISIKAGAKDFKRYNSTLDLRERKMNGGLSRSSSTLEPNSTLVKQVSIIKKEEMSINVSESLEDVEQHRLSKLSEYCERETPKQIELKSKENLGKKNPELKLNKVLNNVKGVYMNVQKLAKENSINKVKKPKKNREKKTLTGNKRDLAKAFKSENELRDSKENSKITTNEKKHSPSLDVNENSLDEKLDNFDDAEAFKGRGDNILAVDEDVKVGSNDLCKAVLPTIEEENRADTENKKPEKVERAQKSEDRKWKGGAHSLEQLSTFGEKKTGSATPKHYFRIGRKKVLDLKPEGKFAQSMKIEVTTDERIDYKREGKIFENTVKSGQKKLKSLFTPKVSTTKQIIVAYSMNNLASPHSHA